MPDVPIKGFPSNLFAAQVTIKAGTAASEMFAPQGKALIGLYMPAAWDTADIGYQSCISGNPIDLLNAYSNGGTPETTQVDASRYIPFPSFDALFAPFIVLTSVDAGSVTPAVQSADRVITLLFRYYLT